MRYQLVLNKDGGTLRTVDIDTYCAHATGLFEAAGHTISCQPVGGGELVSALVDAFADEANDGVIAAGGDGTISAAAELAWKYRKPLGIIPAGTMNLFARALAIPLEIGDAAAALATGHVIQADIATANGQPFIHQFSIGFHARMVRLRNRRQFGSKLGKIGASIVAALDVMRRPPSLPIQLRIDGVITRERLSSLAITNNPYGEGHLPYADRVTQGVLGIYYARPANAAQNARMLADLTLGTWRNNPDITEKRGRKVEVEFLRRRRKHYCVIDGELQRTDSRVEVILHPGELPVIAPAEMEPES